MIFGAIWCFRCEIFRPSRRLGRIVGFGRKKNYCQIKSPCRHGSTSFASIADLDLLEAILEREADTASIRIRQTWWSLTHDIRRAWQDFLLSGWPMLLTAVIVLSKEGVIRRRKKEESKQHSFSSNNNTLLLLVQLLRKCTYIIIMGFLKSCLHIGPTHLLQLSVATSTALTSVELIRQRFTILIKALLYLIYTDEQCNASGIAVLAMYDDSTAM